jgi:inhibitor of cysteine peptidase
MIGKYFYTKLNRKFKILTCAAVVTVLLAAGFSIFSLGNYDVANVLNSNSSPKEFLTVRTVENLKKLIDKYQPENTGSMEGSSYSQTNIQVAGVDEGDIVKNDGSYIYKIVKGYDKYEEAGVQIIKVYPEEELELVTKILLKDMEPEQIFIKDNYLVIISSRSEVRKVPIETGKKPTTKWIINRTAAHIYDIKDRKNPKLIREIEVDGVYGASQVRMIGNRVYIVSQKYLSKEDIRIEEGYEEMYLPSYKDSAAGDDVKKVTLDKVRYFPEAYRPCYIIVSSFSLDNLEEEIEASVVFGLGANIYCSNENLYVQGYINNKGKDETALYRFKLDGGKVKFAAYGKAPGKINNQFSMDEYKGHFRVTTTSRPIKHEVKRGKGKIPVEFGETKNNLYVFDENMKMIGKLEDLAEGESIYSTRFMGDRAYMVTFEVIDPLFVIDLQDPTDPKVLGELKIPGFSTYLHPYDEKHIIGFGRNTTTIESYGREEVICNGMKISIIDVSDVNNPKEKFITNIGGIGTFSELLENHRALLFLKDKALMAFPVSEGQCVEIESTLQEEVKITFHGAHVYRMNMDDGLELKGKISHMIDGVEFNYEKEHWDSTILRILYIDNNLYTISENSVKIFNIESLAEKAELKLD